LQQDAVRMQGLETRYSELTEEVKRFETAMKSGSSKQKTAAWKELRNAAE
jgi:hypothetical protein